MLNKKSAEVEIIFNKISYKYDFLNNLLSLGLHNLWKRRLVKMLRPIDGENWADLCCGTGDLSFLLYKRIRFNGSIIGIDNAEHILKVAKEKSVKFGNYFIKWETKDIFDIEDNKNNFDGICMSYGLRNLYDVEKGINKVFNLDF